MSLTDAQAAIIADQQRVWETRRFCQVRHAHAKLAAGTGHGGGDAALSALLRCLLYELDADIGAISLLDEETQHFLSVIQRSSLHGLGPLSSEWFGCERISHRGGICQKTISRSSAPGDHPIYEILDLAADESTKDLPVVNGIAANLRHYAGVSITAPNGLNIGTLFVFREKVSRQFLSSSQTHFMCETARHVTTQLNQTLEALENKRSLQCNAAVSSMLDNDVSKRPSEAHSIPLGSQLLPSPGRDTSSTHNIYKMAVDLLADALELDGVLIQELPAPKSAANIYQPSRQKLLASHGNSAHGSPGRIQDAVAQQLLQSFPSGAVIRLLTQDQGGEFHALAQGSPGRQHKVQLNLCGQFDKASQFVFQPLRDSFHDRDVAFILGFKNDFSRVFSSTTDLPPLSSFGMAVMTQVRRLEAQTLSRNKSDFLGSMSHEMRSPLHGILACVELLQQSDCTSHQQDLLDSAEACGLQLRENIDNILLYSNIGSPSPSSEKSQRASFPQHREDISQGKNNILALVEDTIGRDARKNKSTTPAASKGENLLWTNDHQIVNKRSIDPAYHTIIAVDANPHSDFALVRYSGISVIINNLLGNSIKFTGSDACIRVSLETDDDTVKLRFIDAGRGMSPDYIKNLLLVPFAQQNPLDTGTGLGLALVQSAVQALDGKTTIDTDEAKGTEVAVSLPRSRLAVSTTKTPSDSDSQKSAEEDTPKILPLTIRLLAPKRWQQPHDLRYQRCLDALTASLTRNLCTWLELDLRTWEDTETLPQVMFLLHTDLELLKTETGDAFAGLQKVILCPDAQAESTVKALEPGAFATIVGAVTPSKICTAVSLCHNNLQREQGSQDVSRRKSSALLENRNSTPEAGNGLIPASPLETNTEQFVGSNQANGRPPIELPNRTKLKAPEISPAPKFLLVDDNSINLKVVGMYAKRCSKKPSVSAGGGQEAIDAFKAASSDSETADFDIILLDLSMPEVSGFDVALAVRNLEDRDQSDKPRTYIAALTGLVSDKDRDAAFAAGVDEYVTKPATLKDLQNVVANWRASREMPP